MGNLESTCCVSVQNDLRKQLERDDVGNIIKLQKGSKIDFVNKVAKQKLKKNKVNLLQPQTVSPQMGFLYKLGIFFYEGSLCGETMQGKGKLTLAKQAIQYQGMFKNNKFQGNGSLTNKIKGLTISGFWMESSPKDIFFTKNNMQYRIIFLTSLSDIGPYKGTIYYPNKQKYDGIFQYDQKQKKFSLNGKGKLYYPNGDTLSGIFKEGNLDGIGQFYSSKRGKYVGHFKNGKFDGEGQFYFSDKKILNIKWRENKPNGKGIIKIGNEQTPVQYSNGKRILQKQTEPNEQ